MAKKKGLDILAITNDIQSFSISDHSIYSGDMIAFGLDNSYPNKVFEIIQNSPTAGGCVKRKSEFIFGQGADTDIIVNRHEQTLNDIIMASAMSMSRNNGFALHFNYDLFGQIVEIQTADIRYIRKLKGLQEAVIGKISQNNRVIYVSDKRNIRLPLYKPNGIKGYIKLSKGFKKFKGAIYYFNGNSGVYPTCPMEASLTSAQFEHEAQTFSYMHAKNGFSSSGILKLPDMPDDPKKKKEMEEEISKVIGSRNAGSMIVVEAPKTMEGGIEAGKLFEPFQQANVDKLHETQCNRSKDYILRDFNMPEILLGVSDSGMFNQESFRDAFDYYNGDMERDRKMLERAFNKFWPETSFSGEVPEVEIIPLEMKTETQTQEESEEVEEEE